VFSKLSVSLTTRGSVRVIRGFISLFCSVTTDVFWLNLSRTGAGVNRNTSKYRQYEKLSTEPLSFRQKRFASFPWRFLIRYQFLFLEWPLAVL